MMKKTCDEICDDKICDDEICGDETCGGETCDSETYDEKMSTVELKINAIFISISWMNEKCGVFIW